MSTPSSFTLPPLFFTRHAQSVVNADAALRYASHTAVIGLSATGRLQLGPLADFFARTITKHGWNEVTVLISPYLRCQLTAAPVVARLEKLGVTVHTRTESLLREFNSGYYSSTHPLHSHPEWEAMRCQALNDGAYQYFQLPGGESLAQLEAVQETFLNKLALRYPPRGQALLCFGHGVSGRLLFKALAGHDWPWYQAQPNFANASVRLYENQTDQGFVFEQEPALLTNSLARPEAA